MVAVGFLSRYLNSSLPFPSFQWNITTFLICDLKWDLRKGEVFLVLPINLALILTLAQGLSSLSLYCVLCLLETAHRLPLTAVCVGHKLHTGQLQAVSYCSGCRPQTAHRAIAGCLLLQCVLAATNCTQGHCRLSLTAVCVSHKLLTGPLQAVSYCSGCRPQTAHRAIAGCLLLQCVLATNCTQGHCRLSLTAVCVSHKLHTGPLQAVSYCSVCQPQTAHRAIAGCLLLQCVSATNCSQGHCRLSLTAVGVDHKLHTGPLQAASYCSVCRPHRAIAGCLLLQCVSATNCTQGHCRLPLTAVGVDHKLHTGPLQAASYCSVCRPHRAIAGCLLLQCVSATNCTQGHCRLSLTAVCVGHKLHTGPLQAVSYCSVCRPQTAHRAIAGCLLLQCVSATNCTQGHCRLSLTAVCVGHKLHTGPLQAVSYCSVCRPQTAHRAIAGCLLLQCVSATNCTQGHCRLSLTAVCVGHKLHTGPLQAVSYCSVCRPVSMFCVIQ